MAAVREYSNPGLRSGGYSHSISPRNALTKRNIASLESASFNNYGTAARPREPSLLTMARGTSAMKH